MKILLMMLMTTVRLGLCLGLLVLVAKDIVGRAFQTIVVISRPFLARRETSPKWSNPESRHQSDAT